MEFLNKDIKRKMFLIFFAVLTWWLFSNIELVKGYINIFLAATSPLLIGFVISFILNKPMMFFERSLFKSSKINKKTKRNISLFLTLIAFTLGIFVLILIVIPNLVNTGVELKDKFPSYINGLKEYFKNSSIKYTVINEWVQNINTEAIKENLINFVKVGLFDWLGSTFSLASSLFGNIISFFLALIFSIYFLLQKEEIIELLKRLLSIIVPDNVFNKTLYIGGLTKKAFSDFILAQSLESVLLGFIFFITMTLFKFPYATMISVVIAVFSFVPLVGSFVGLVIGVILIFVESPKLSGLFIIIFLIIQQLEGNLIYPKVVGKLSGLSPLLTLAAVSLGGSLFGITGMILFVPIFSVIQKLLAEFMESKSI